MGARPSRLQQGQRTSTHSRAWSSGRASYLTTKNSPHQPHLHSLRFSTAPPHPFRAKPTGPAHGAARHRGVVYPAAGGTGHGRHLTRFVRLGLVDHHKASPAAPAVTGFALLNKRPVRDSVRPTPGNGHVIHPVAAGGSDSTWRPTATGQGVTNEIDSSCGRRSLSCLQTSIQSTAHCPRRKASRLTVNETEAPQRHVAFTVWPLRVSSSVPYPALYVIVALSP
jgi:hypothetical protein